MTDEIEIRLSTWAIEALKSAHPDLTPSQAAELYLHRALEANREALKRGGKTAASVAARA